MVSAKIRKFSLIKSLSSSYFRCASRNEDCREYIEHTGLSRNCDIIKCPFCRRLTPTGKEGALRDTLEAWATAARPYPPVAAGRAIGYAAGIYGYATHGKKIQSGKIEQQLAETHGSEEVRAKEVRAVGKAFRSLGKLKDKRAGLVGIMASGETDKRKWHHLYLVFRGSRGSTQDTGEDAVNPKGAGWGEVVTGDKVEMGNLDWRANFKNYEQHVPGWAADPVRIHAGFLEIYGSVQEAVCGAVEEFLGQHPNGTVIVTGHSLGSALSVVCAHHLECSGRGHPFLFGFCPPRVGNLGFVRDFNQKIADVRGRMQCEIGTKFFCRGHLLEQWNDPVSSGGKRGFVAPMPDEVADSGSTASQGWEALWKAESDTVIYYHVKNRHRVAWTGLHKYTAMEEDVLGANIHTL